MNTATRLMKMADNKASVSGTYHGQPFRGTVISSRQVNWSSAPEEITIAVEAGYTFFGQERSHILINSQDVDSGKHQCIERI